MKRTLLWIFFLLASRVDQDQLWHFRNLGKAFYENPTTQKEAVEQFRKALELAPGSARERINYGIALLRAGNTKAGIAELEKAQKQDPSIPHTWFNLGIAFKRDGEFDRGIAQFEQMIKLVPDEPVSHYNLAALLKIGGNTSRALNEFETARDLNPNLAGPHFQLFNAYRQAGRSEDAARELKVFQEIKQRTAGAAVAEDMEWSYYAEIYDPPETAPAIPGSEPKYTDRKIADGIAGIAALDFDGDGRADLIAWSPNGVKLFRNGREPVADEALAALHDVVSIAPGDFDNDGFPDLCVVTKAGAALYHNDKGKFSRRDVVLPGGNYTKAIWIDYDHDYDLDLMLLGEHSTLMRNNGDAGFSPVAFPFENGKPLDAVLFAVREDTSARDLVVSYQDHAGVLYRDGLNGKFEAVPIGTLPAGADALEADDFNHDQFLDVVSWWPNVARVQNERGSFSRVEAGITPAARAVAALGTDAARLDRDGTLHLLEMQKTVGQNWMRVQIVGVKNLKLATGATVEVKAGAYYYKKIYDGIPLTFPLGHYAEADTVRITWPNGLIQNETHQKPNVLLSFKEAQRLSGSCPMIFTWNGKEFEFITDVLGVAPLGASLGDGQYFPVDHDEYVQIAGESLAAVNGKYEIRITEELREVSYLDQIRLIAVDHPAAVEIFTNDKFKSPPFPEFRLFGVRRRIYPERAVDDQGRDVRPALLRRDRVYPDGFQRDYAGVAEVHHLDLAFGNAARDNHAVLILNGWVDWADGSTFLGASQQKNGGLVLPYLQVKDGTGNWRTVIDDMGIPAGKPKTISVDLTGKFLSASREVRIVTNLCVYWDEIFLSEDTDQPAVNMTALDAASADLHFRGFSKPVIHPQRKQPEIFDYAHQIPESMWNPTPGMYTHYGNVQELVTALDDRMVIMGSGDELRLLYPAQPLPKLPAGWRRDFLLLVDGWAKDADANTAFSQTVEPLPFHGMSAYPYRSDEHFPDDALHTQYRKKYLTRPALRIIRPLVEQKMVEHKTE